MEERRILIVTFPAPGHINPGLQLARRLIWAGAEVTFATTAGGRRSISDSFIPGGLKFAFYSIGHDDERFNMNKIDLDHYMSEVERHGSLSLAEVIKAAESAHRPFTCLVYATLIPWAARVARYLHVPSTLLWNQSATIFDIYYYYFNGYGDVLRNSQKDPSTLVHVPGLPLLSPGDLPSYLLPTNTHDFALPMLEEHMRILRDEDTPKVLMNTYEKLEPDQLRAVEGLELVAVGPSVPSVSLEAKQPSSKSESPKAYLRWLDSKPESSVIYVSFGSYSFLPKQQMVEIARALIESNRPFLWVVRALDFREEGQEEEEVVSYKEELEELGMIVAWCSQEDVLSHSAVGCFVTHCGWNSTLESLVAGVPAVAFPLWTDQATNAKMIEEVWRKGVRVRPNGEGLVEREEVKRCLDLVVGGGERGEEMRKNAGKWSALAREAAKEGGSADKSVKAFVDGLGRG